MRKMDLLASASLAAVLLAAPAQALLGPGGHNVCDFFSSAYDPNHHTCEDETRVETEREDEGEAEDTGESSPEEGSGDDGGVDTEGDSEGDGEEGEEGGEGDDFGDGLTYIFRSVATL